MPRVTTVPRTARRYWLSYHPPGNLLVIPDLLRAADTPGPLAGRTGERGTQRCDPAYVTYMIGVSFHRAHAAVGALIVAASACAKHRAETTPGVDPAAAAGIERLRAATRPFQSLDMAVAAGYAKDVPDCLVHEHHGAMGYHHVNRSYLTATPTVERPQILLYERLPNGKYRLNGVEFIVPYRLWPRDSVPPVLMGQRLKHEDNLNIWYLHVWAWTTNSDGVFADFNPVVTCPEASRKIFKPFALLPTMTSIRAW